MNIESDMQHCCHGVDVNFVAFTFQQSALRHFPNRGTKPTPPLRRRFGKLVSLLLYHSAHVALEVLFTCMSPPLRS